MTFQNPTLTIALLLSQLLCHFNLTTASPLALKGPGADNCPAPQVECDNACCNSYQTCSATGHCVTPPPPAPGKIWITYYTEPFTSKPDMIELHGSGFVQGASVSIAAAVEFEYSPGVMAWKLQNYFEAYDPTAKSFDYKTGVQDCGMLRGGATLGQVTRVQAWDPYVSVWVNANDVRAPKDGGVGKQGNCYARG